MRLIANEKLMNIYRFSDRIFLTQPNPQQGFRDRGYVLKSICVFFLFLSYFNSSSQKYNGERTHKNDLLHTKLELKPDWSKQHLHGTATLTFKPYFYEQNTLELDAKGFDIQSITMNDKPLKYSYDKLKLNIDLEKNFARKDTFVVQIKYVAKPNELTVKGSDAILSDKGLYFINPLEKEPNKPRQLWTQGETEANSCWFPTIDSPNEKMTQEVLLTVENQFITLSNGKLISSKQNTDGTRTDYWKQDKPHAPYLAMIAVGNFKKVIDPTFDDFEVSYYVEPQFEKYALPIFGRTPEMIRYFEKLLGVQYQWDKYSQIPVRDYVSGAMENTTATIHGENIQKDFNQLIDDNDDGVIAHELFHHWFGDLVTCESWSNLPLNESFADYSEYLWINHKYGRDEGDLVAMNALMAYLGEAEQKREPLIRYLYLDKEDMFDAHSYSKGGRVLHLLRKQVGDDAFFAALNLYLTQNAFKTTEIHDLRKAFEETTGEDLNWFFNQWFMSAGHPELEVSHEFSNGKLKLNVSQTQDISKFPTYRLPLTVEIWNDKSKETHKIWLEESNQNFEFSCDKSPKMVLIDPESILVGTIKHQKSKEELLFQAKNAERFPKRLEALEIISYVAEDDSTAKDPLSEKNIRQALLDATKDNFWRVRQFAVQKFRDYDGEDFLEVEKALQSRIKNDERSYVRADAIIGMKNFMNPQNDLLFRQALNDTSSMVRASAIEAILLNKPPDANELALKYENSVNSNIIVAVANYYSEDAKPEKLEWFMKHIQAMNGGDLYNILGIFGAYLIKSDENVQQKSLPLLKKIAGESTEWFVRFAGVQTMALIVDNPKVKSALKEIIAKETDERLKKIYKQFDNL